MSYLYFYSSTSILYFYQLWSSSHRPYAALRTRLPISNVDTNTDNGVTAGSSYTNVDKVLYSYIS